MIVEVSGNYWQFISSLKDKTYNSDFEFTVFLKVIIGYLKLLKGIIVESSGY